MIPIHPDDQAWFWTPEWQAGETEVDEAMTRGQRGRVFGSGEEFLAFLDQNSKPASYPGWVGETGRPSMPDGQTAHVWWGRRRDASPRLAGLLDQAERQRWASYRREEDRERFLVGCALAKTVIAACAGRRPEQVSFDRTCRHCGKPHGKPIARDIGLEHSVAHSGDVVAVAVARAPVGVDVERLEGRPRRPGGGDPEALARMVLSDTERAALAAVQPSGRDRAFLVAWTRKEAVTKAKGDGLRVPFGDVVVAGAEGAPRLVAWPYPQAPQGVSLHDLDAGRGYVGALAVIGRCDEVLVKDGSALLAGVR
jgi:4'-phosphopantetheinyl transferase